ncbi:MAG: hypothetical protein U0792_25080 [Gemmataceae bacterium]
MHIAQFVHRYPPAIGGAEAYTARLCEFLANRGDTITVWTTTAIELEEFWRWSRSRLGVVEREKPQAATACQVGDSPHPPLSRRPPP